MLSRRSGRLSPLLRLSLILGVLGMLLPGTASADDKDTRRLPPLYRHSILVNDLERSLTLYRDVIGLRVSRISQLEDDSYSNGFFNVPKGSMRRFAYLHGEDDHGEVLGLGEAPGVELNVNDNPRNAAFVMTVADPEAILVKIRDMGLTTIDPYEFTSRTGPQGIEFGFLDFDGHLVLLYGLKVSELSPQ